jgi:hypothetical protein
MLAGSEPMNEHRGKISIGQDEWIPSLLMRDSAPPR